MDRASADALIDAAAWWEGWGYFASALVLIGVVGESIELIRSSFGRGSSKAKLIPFVILVAGLLGEIITQYEANKHTGALEDAIKTHLASRALTAGTVEEIGTKLSKYRGQRYSGLISSSGTDIRPLWNAIDGALGRAGWVRVAPRGMAVGDPPAAIAVEADPGIVIVVAKGAVADEIAPARAFAEILLGAGISTQVGIDSAKAAEAETSVLIVSIGLKP